VRDTAILYSQILERQTQYNTSREKRWKFGEHSLPWEGMIVISHIGLHGANDLAKKIITNQTVCKDRDTSLKKEEQRRGSLPV